MKQGYRVPWIPVTFWTMVINGVFMYYEPNYWEMGGFFAILGSGFIVAICWGFFDFVKAEQREATTEWGVSRDKLTIVDMMKAGGYTVKQEDDFYYAVIGEDYIRMGTWRYNVSLDEVVCIDVAHKVKSGTMLGLQEGMAREKEKYYEVVEQKRLYNERKKNGFEGFVKMEEE